jgi:translocation and assembly module TamB
MRRFLAILAMLAALFAALVLLSPYWLPLALPVIGRPLRATVGSYSRIGYTRFALSDVTVERRTVTVHVTRVEADTPWLWAARHLLHRDHPIVAGKWSVHVHTSYTGQGQHEEEGWVELQAHLSRISNGLEKWLRNAVMGAGSVDWPRNEITLEHATWRGRSLQVEKLQWRDFRSDVDLVFDKVAGRWDLTAHGTTPQTEVKGHADGAHVQGELVFNNQHAPFSMDFPAVGWMPRKATVDAANWTLPSEFFHLHGYTGLSGTTHAFWADDQFSVVVEAQGNPTPGAPYPPVKVSVHARGDRSNYAVEKLDVTIPGVDAHLDHPVEGSFARIENPTTRLASHFNIRARLAEIPGVKATGELQGNIEVQPRERGVPILQFTAQGHGIAWGQFHASSAHVAGDLSWPVLTVREAQLSAAANSSLALSGRVDFTARTLADVKVNGVLESSLFQPWLPAGVTLARVHVNAQAQGPFASFQQQGRVDLEDLRVRQFQPAAVHLNWEGEGTMVKSYDLSIQTGHTEISAAGSADLEEIKFNRFVWRQGGVDRLTLQTPAHVVWLPSFKIEGLDLLGPAGELHLSAAWGEKGQIAFFARGIESAWWSDLLPVAPFNWSVNNVYLKANWDHGPVTADTTAQLTVRLEDRVPIAVALSANTNGKSIVLQQLQASEKETELANFSGEFPLQLFIAPRPHVNVEHRVEMRVQGKLNQTAPEWTELAKRVGITLVEPDVSLSLAGTVDEPRGSLTFAASELQLDERYGHRAWPKIERLHADFSASGSKIELTSAGLSIAGQSIDLSGALPLRGNTWSELRKNPLVMLRRDGALRLRVPDADLGSIAPLIAPELFPQGRLDADISLSGSAPWQGHLRFHDLATKPIGSLGRLRNIHGDLSFENRDIVFNDVELGFGERPIKLTGRVHVENEGAPRIELSATGEDLPFVRQAGLLVRGNVNLTLTSASRKTLRPIIRGKVQLTDGLFVSDVRSLIPRGGGSGPQLRPPYFAVETDPFKDWRIDVDVQGDKFLRAKTTVFNGLMSMKFHLFGTLGDPRALGELRIREGQVLFPFATFALNDASVRLTDSNPYDPSLGLFGTSHRYGYDLNMEITGNASAPVISFSSNPALTSEQVLLMVMAGEVPKDEINYSTSQKISRLGTFFGQSLLGSLGGGSGQDRLTITTGEEVSITGRETYDVEYALNDRWSLVGEYDEFDDYNAGVKWKILRRHKKDETKK